MTGNELYRSQRLQTSAIFQSRLKLAFGYLILVFIGSQTSHAIEASITSPLDHEPGGFSKSLYEGIDTSRNFETLLRQKLSQENNLSPSSATAKKQPHSFKHVRYEHPNNRRFRAPSSGAVVPTSRNSVCEGCHRTVHLTTSTMVNPTSQFGFEDVAAWAVSTDMVATELARYASIKEEPILFYGSKDSIDTMHAIEQRFPESTPGVESIASHVLTNETEIKSRRAIYVSDPDSLATFAGEFGIQEPTNDSERYQILEDNLQSYWRNWSEIQSYGTLRLITMNRPTTFYLWRGEFAGFEYDLMLLFATSHNLKLSVLVVSGIDEATEVLKNGRGDVIAASLAPTQTRKNNGLVFSNTYLPVEEVIVSRFDAVERMEYLGGRAVHANPSTSFYENLIELQTDIEFSIVRRSHTSTERLVAEVANGEIDLTVVDSHMFAAIAATDERIKRGASITRTHGLSWAVLNQDSVLLAKLNEWIHENYRGLEYNLARQRYFEVRDQIVRQSVHRIRGDVLSSFDHMVKLVASRYKFDWRLITSQMYQESKFNPNALSRVGAIGLLQMMPRTAEELEISPEELYEPEVAIEAGVRYLDWVRLQFQSISPIEQHWFALAAYNAGIGHVHDARGLSRRLGLNENQWFGNVEVAMLKLSQPEYYQNVRYGYVRGREPVDYVRNIRDRYEIYVAHFAELSRL